MATNNFKEKMAEERDYYMGKTDKIPGSSKTVKEARKDYLKEVEKADKADAKKREAWLKSQDVTPEERTTAVTHDTVRTDIVDPTEVVSAPAAKPDGFTKSGLKAKSKAELITIATDLGKKVVPDTDTVDEIIDIILAK